MKTYTKPEIEINALDNADVVTASGGINITKFSQTQGKNYNVIDNF